MKAKSMKNRWAIQFLVGCCLVSLAGVCHGQGKGQSKDDRPNIVLIFGDDIGFSDIGCYGSEIQTPNLDRLAKNGMRMTQFYNMAKCESSRTSLLSGLYVDRENATNAVPFPALLRSAGYYTAMCGKEHLRSWLPEDFLVKNCFEDSFSFHKINEYFELPQGGYEYPFELNGKTVSMEKLRANASQLPLFKTDFLTDYALEFLTKAESDDRPFFLYLPYHAAHYPLQARPEDIAKYRGSYRKGWDKIRQQRFEKQKQLGIIGSDVQLSPPSDNVNSNARYANYQPWDSLSEIEKDELDLEMSVFAGQVDRLDVNIGRVLDKLKSMGEMENTLVLFFADNGACPYARDRTKGVSPGGADSYVSLSAMWANVGSTPFRYYKQYGHEGGCRTHCVAHWPGKIKPSINSSPGHIVDIYPTFLELAGASYPGKNERGKTPKLDGSSLLPILKSEARPDSEIMVSGYKEKLRMARFGDWKVVHLQGKWHLYNVKDDPTELNDLAKAYPKKLKSLVAKYKAWRAQK